MSQQPPTLAQIVRGTQILTVALTIGVVGFMAIAVVVGGALDNSPSGVLISGIAAGYTVIAFVLHLVIPSMIAGQHRSDASDEQLGSLFQRQTIVSVALLEGAAFFNIIACMIEHNRWSLAVAGGLVFWMLARFPTQTRVEHWVETRRIGSGR